MNSNRFRITISILLFVLLVASSFSIYSTSTPTTLVDIKGIVQIQYSETYLNGTYDKFPDIDGPVDINIPGLFFVFNVKIIIVNPYDVRVSHTYDDGCLGQIDLYYENRISENEERQDDNLSNLRRNLQSCQVDPLTISLEPGFNQFEGQITYGWQGQDIDLDSLPDGRYIFSFDPQIGVSNDNFQRQQETVITYQDGEYHIDEASLSYFDFETWWISFLLSVNIGMMTFNFFVHFRKQDQS